MIKQLRFKVLLFIAFAINLSLSVTARDFDKVQIQTHKITENVYMLTGAEAISG
ncbi:MAG: hypothetical protein GWO07_03875 [Candidatus Dadabacteria bacterium]|nr:hypothetical protein [Candidatus Dadabacteria bacterium]NIV42928.1 hypothetical protein [Candidatus Dadabacteria bacterium]NIX14892.1 hypothetical protein [Candidatus Dadabacteria bacterium]